MTNIFDKKTKAKAIDFKSLKAKKSPKMSKTKIAIAKLLVNKFGLYQHTAAALLGVNQGRISEAVNNFPDIKLPKEPPDDDQLKFGL